MSLTTLGKIAEAVRNRPAQIEAARREGKKAVGLLGYNIPEEIVHALGLIPFRLGNGGSERVTELGSRYLSSKTCVFCRHSVGVFADKKNAYTNNSDLVIFDTTCLQLFRVSELVKYYFKVNTLVLGVPKNYYLPEGKQYFIKELQWFTGELEKFADWRVIEAIEDVKQYTRLGDKEVSASQLAKRLGFSGGRQQTRVSDLSGGERRRLQFLRLLMAEPNVLILDEPTNDLDIETLTSMEDVLDGWAGTLLVVSHDRYLLERMCDRQVALLGDGAIRDLPGGVEQYLLLRHGLRASATASGASVGSRVSVRAGGPAGAGDRNSRQSAADLREAKKDLNRIDRQLAKLSAHEDRIHADMAAKAADHSAVLALNDALRAIVAERETLELEWLSLAETIG